MKTKNNHLCGGSISCPPKAPWTVNSLGKKKEQVAKMLCFLSPGSVKVRCNMGHIYCFCGPSIHGSGSFRTQFPLWCGEHLTPLRTRGLDETSHHSHLSRLPQRSSSGWITQADPPTGALPWISDTWALRGRILPGPWDHHLDSGCLDHFPSCCHHTAGAHSSQCGPGQQHHPDTRWKQELQILLNLNLHFKKIPCDDPQWILKSIL